MWASDDTAWEDKENLGQLFQALKGQWGKMRFVSYDS